MSGQSLRRDMEVETSTAVKLGIWEIFTCFCVLDVLYLFINNFYIFLFLYHTYIPYSPKETLNCHFLYLFEINCKHCECSY